jgi:alkylhydroperoxidase family enzyme
MRVDLPEAHRMEPLAHLAESYAPEIVRAGNGFSATTYAMSKLSMREFEGARYRTAQINGCQLCQNYRVARDRNVADGPSITHNGAPPDEAFYDAVYDYRTSPILTVREKLAVEFAEGMGLDPRGLAVNEHFWTRFRSVFSDDEVVDLAYCVAGWLGLGRVAHVLGLDDICAIPALRSAAAS